MTDRKSVLIRAEPALWAQVDSYASKEGITRNEAVIRLLGVGLSGPAVGNPIAAEPKGEIPLRLASGSGPPGPTGPKPKKPPRGGSSVQPPPRPALDLPIGPVRRAPGSMLISKKGRA